MALLACKKKVALGAFAILFVSQTAFGQTGLFYYPLKNPKLPNARVAGIIEEKGNLYICSRTSDEQYKTHNLLMQTVGLNGNFISEQYTSIPNLWELVSCQLMNDTSFSIFGNLLVNKLHQPFQSNIGVSGKSLKSYNENVVFSTHIKDVAADKSWNFELLTKESKGNQYNISLRKASKTDNNTEWIKRISSEQNEEGDKVLCATDGNIIILGRKYNDDKTDYVPIIYKLNPQGDVVWKKAIDVPGSFYTQSIGLTQSNTIIYMCGYTKNPTGISETRTIKLDSSGEPIANYTMSDFSANGLLILNNGTILFYGSRFFINEKQVVTKGKFVITDMQLVEKANVALDKTDKPDSEFKKQISTSSDFLTATEMEDGRIAIGGRVFMPNPENNSIKQNNPLLLIVKADGSYQK